MTNPDNVGGQYDRELIALMLEVYASTHEAPMWPLHRESTIREQVKLLRDADSAEAARVRTVCRAAPAGSGEVEGITLPAEKLFAGPERDHHHGYVSGWNECLAAIRDLLTKAKGWKEEAALLRKLQQGADYVMVPRDSAKMVTHVCSEWIDLFRAAPGIEKYERYSYEPAVEELRDEYAAIAASQGQEGGHARD